ncbi:uncharacterized protein LOC120116281 [Hibiscus syriacus]|uniref:uncharacterized protein LOC120116281 n=1 Tax=Hibiscus syriacus TaxID=106335 RepID=UPI0019249158|nr:uncharacterized protein LOC120116281 [Hibiscus syriacus]
MAMNNSESYPRFLLSEVSHFCERILSVGIKLLVSLQSKGSMLQIARSFSVPINEKEGKLRRMDSFFRVVPSTPRVKEGEISSNASNGPDAENNGPDGEDIPEEEAVCRICMVELCEGG